MVVSHFGFDGRALVLIASVPGHCLPIAILKLGQLTGNDEYIHMIFLDLLPFEKCGIVNLSARYLKQYLN